MDKLSDFIDEIKVRLRNPFVASFIFSWFIWNWKIWVGLFWLNDSSLSNIGHSSYIDFVAVNLSITSTFCYPFGSALLLILVLPLVRNFIEMYQAWTMQWGEKKVLEISKSGVMSFEKYLEKKNEVENLKNEILKLSQTERDLELSRKEYKFKYEQSIEEKQNTDHKLRVLENQVQSAFDHNKINGRWKMNTSINGITTVDIIAGTLRSEGKQIGQILHFVFLKETCMFCLQLQDNHILAFRFPRISENVMIGTINDSQNVEWTKLLD
jgi:hypothetical protein